MDFATLASKLNVPSFGLLSSRDYDFDSLFFYRKVKRKLEIDIKALELPVLTIYKPGLIINRQNDFRLEEAIASHIPYISKIDAADLGRFILID